MKKSLVIPFIASCFIMFQGCSNTPKTEGTTATTVATPSQPNLAQVRTDIQSIENRWAAAMNAKDINALMNLYADDAISMPDGKPILSGKAAIRKEQEEQFAKPANFASVAFETLDVYAQGNVVTEVGKTMFKDASGKVTRTGKYVAIFEERDGQYVCIREIFNDDSK
jgi:uncharacterized protein (TIGR02246 family)